MTSITAAATTRTASSPEEPSTANDLWAIACIFGVVSSGLFVAGRILESPVLSFTGVMTIASTFIPMPADAYVIAASARVPALTIGVVGGAVNAAAVLGPLVAG